MSSSFTGYLGMQRENARFENNLKKRPGDLYFSKETGFDRDLLDSENIDFSPETVSAWIISQAALRGIVVMSSQIVDNAPVQSLHYQIAGSESVTASLGGF